MRTIVFFVSLFFFSSAGLSRAQDPGAQQDAEAAREKILKAADQIDLIESNSEANKPVLDGMKTDLAKLQTDVAELQADNTALKQQLADLQTAFNQAQAAHAKEQKALVDTIAGMIATSKTVGPKIHPKKKEPETKAAPTDSGDATGPASASTSTSAPTPTPSDPGAAPTKTQKGYYHIVASGETLTLIAAAYRQGGLNVTIPEIQKANGLSDKSVLKVGQKLFIPKPGN